MPWTYDIRDYDKAQIVLKKLNFKSILRHQKTKYNSSEAVKSCPQPNAVTEDKHDSEENVSATDSADAQNNVSAINDENLVPNKMYKVVLVDGQLTLAEHDEDEENVEQSDGSNAEKKNNVNENVIVNTEKKPASSAPTVRLNKVDNHHVGPNTPNKAHVLKKLNLKSKVQDDKTKNISSEPVKSCPQPKGIIFNYKIKKRATIENKPVTENKHNNKPVREENHDKKQNVSTTDSADDQNNVSAINDANLVQNKMYKVVLVDGQLTLAEHDEDYIVEENVGHTNESNEEIVDTDNCEKNNGSATEDITESPKKKPAVSPPTVILNKVLYNNNAGNTPKNIESYSLNMDSNENLVQNITISGPKNKMYATLDDLADAREGKAMVLLPLEKYTRLKTQLKESQICEETLRRQEEILKIQINGYQMQQEYHMEEEAKLNDQIRKLNDQIPKMHDQIRKLYDQIRKLKINDEMNQKIIKEKLSKVLKHTESQTGPYMEEELKELETLRAFNIRMCEIFNEAQIAVMMCCPKKVKECPWPDVDKEKVLFLSQIISQTAYSFLKNKMNFPLPTWINVRRWMRERNIPVKSKSKVPMGKWPADTVNVAAQESAQTQNASAISLQTYDERISITILSQDEHMHTIQPQDEHMHTIQPQDEHMHTIQPQEEHMHTIQLQDEHMHTIQPQDEHMHTIQPQSQYVHPIHYQNVETETTRAIHSIVDHQENEDANEYLQPTMDSNLYSDYMQNDDIASTEEVVHTEMTPTEVTPTDVTHTEVTHTEVTHTEVKTKRVLHFLPRCRLCMISFMTEEEVREHVSSHYQNSSYTMYLDARKPYTCEFCNEVVKDRHHLVYHHRGHLGIDPLKCYYPGCNYSGGNTANLISHLDRHKPAVFKCEQCPAVFRTFNYLRGHRSSHSTRRSRRCALCRTVCLTDYTYQQHMLSHNKPPRIRCRSAGCPERFYSRVLMRQHFNATHELMFHCPRCPGASFGFKKHLNKHLRQHETRKVTHCVKCMKVFYDYGEYYAHWLEHKNNKEKCACGERFADKDKLAEHTLQCTFVPSKEIKVKTRGRKRKYPKGDPNNIKPNRLEHKNNKEKCACGERFADKDKLAEHKLQCTFVPSKEIKVETRGRKRKYSKGDPNNIKPKRKREDKLAEHKLQCTFVPSEEIKLKTRGRKRKYPEGDPNNIKPKRKREPKKKRLNTTVEKNANASKKTCKPNIIIQKQEIIKEAHVIQFKEVAISPDIQIVLEDNDSGKPGKILKLKKVDALPANFRDKLIPLPPNFQQKVIALPTKNQQKVYAPKAKSETKVIALPSSPQHNDITQPANSQHTDITLPTNPQYTDIILPPNPQHNDITLLADPQQHDITLPANLQQPDYILPIISQHTDITLPANPQYTDITLPANPQHTDITLPANPQHSYITLPANPQHTDITLPANPQYTDITLPANPQYTVITLPANPQHTDITLPANPQHSDITLPANPQHTDITLPANPQYTDITLPANPQHTDITLPANPQHTDITLPANPQHSDITLPVNPQHDDITFPANLQHNDFTLPANPHHTDIILPANPQHSDITLPANSQHTDITLPANPQHTDVTLPANPQHSDITLPANPQHNDITFPANLQHNDFTLPLNPQHSDITLPANSQHTDITLPANPQHNDITLLVNPQHTDITLPENSQQNDITLLADPQQPDIPLSENPQRTDIILPPNPQHTDITLPARPEHTDSTLLVNPQQCYITLPKNLQQPDITLLANSQHTDITLLADQQLDIILPTNLQQPDIILPPNPQNNVITLPTIPPQKIRALSENPQEKPLELPANCQRKIQIKFKNPQQQVTALPVNTQRKIMALPVNTQQKFQFILANPQRKVTVLPVNPERNVTAPPAHPQQRITTLSTNPQERLGTLPVNPQQKVTVLPVNPKRRVTALPANPQQINIAVTANKQDKLISSLDDHLIIKPRGYQPNILDRSGSHHRHVPVTPVPEYNLQDLMSVKAKQNATASQNVKLESGSEVAAAPFSDKNQSKPIISGTKGYYLNKLSIPHGSRAHKIVTVSPRNTISSEVLKDMTYVSEFVKKLKSEENVPKLESVVPKLKKVVPIGMKPKKVVLQMTRASGHQSVSSIPQDVTAVSGFPQRDMPDLEL